MKKCLLILGLFLLTQKTQATERNYYASWGMGFDHPQEEATRDAVKFAEFGLHEKLGRGEMRLGVGGWVDSSNYPGAQSAGYIHALFGVETRPKEGLFLAYYIGPAAIGRTDSLLGSWWQVSHEFQAGLVDTRNVRVYFLAKHFSNASLKKPNEGRNFIGIGLEF